MLKINFKIFKFYIRHTASNFFEKLDQFLLNMMQIKKIIYLNISEFYQIIIFFFEKKLFKRL